jgi:hypothetical protein
MANLATWDILYVTERHWLLRQSIILLSNDFGHLSAQMARVV